MNDLRRSTKTMLLQNATFFGANGWEECIIVDSSKGELKIEFHTKETIKEGSIINIRALIPSVPNPVIVKGILKWIEKKGEYLSGGVEWLSVHKDPIKDINDHVVIQEKYPCGVITRDEYEKAS